MSVRHAVLGLLVQRPRHGYELRAAFEALAGGHENWDVKPAQIYTTLVRMEHGGLIAEQAIEQEVNRIVQVSVAKSLSKVQSVPVTTIEHEPGCAVREALGFRMVLLRIWSPSTQAFEARAFAGISDDGKAHLTGLQITLDRYRKMTQPRFRISRSYFISHKDEAWAEALVAAGHTVFIEAGAGIFANSLALLTDAAHNLTDVIALALSWCAVRLTTQPANAQKTYGYHRAGILVALANSTTVVLISLGIFYEAYRRLLTPPVVRSQILVGVALEAHQLAHDLRIGLAVEAVIGGPRRAEHVGERALHRSLPCTVREQDRTVDVEQSEFHVRVRRRPPMMQAAPRPCQTVGVSPSIAHATITAING